MILKGIKKYKEGDKSVSYSPDKAVKKNTIFTSDEMKGKSNLPGPSKFKTNTKTTIGAGQPMKKETTTKLMRRDKMADGNKKVYQKATGIDKEKGVNTALNPNTQRGKELAKTVNAKSSTFSKKSLEDKNKSKAEANTSIDTSKESIKSTSTKPVTNTKLETYSNKAKTRENSLKDEDSKKTTKTSALTASSKMKDGTKELRKTMIFKKK